MLRKPRKSTHRILRWVGGIGAASACFIALFLFFFPLPVPFVKSWILAQLPPTYHLSLTNVTLVWRHWYRPPELALDHLKATFETQTGSESLHIPRLYLTPRWLDLLRGKGTVQAVTFSSPQWKETDKKTAFFTLEQFQRAALLLFESPQQQEWLNDLPTHLIFENPLPDIWPLLNLKIQRSLKGLQIHIQDTQGFEGTLGLAYKEETRAVDLTLKSHSFSLSHLLSHSGEQTTLLQKIPKITGTLKAQIPLTQPHYQGVFTIEGQTSHPDAIQTLLLKGTWSEQGFFLENGTFSQGETHFSCKGFFQRSSAQEEAHTFSFSVQTAGTGVTQLHSLWPVEMAPLARTWILENIPQGQIGESTLEMAGTLGAHQMLLDFSLKGQLALKDLVVHFLKGMPPVKGVSGVAHFSEKEFDIQLGEGLLEEHTLTKGRVLIQGLELPDQTLTTQLALKGDIPNLIKILSYPPLEYPQKIEVDLKALKGHAETTLNISFPLERELELAQVDLKAKSVLQKVVYDFYIQKASKPLHFDQGAVTLSVTPQHLDLVGKARLQKEPISLNWKWDFQKPQARQLIFESRLNPFILAYWGLDVGNTIRGTFPCQLIYAPHAKQPLRFEATLTPALLNVTALNWSKKPGIQALLKGHLQLPTKSSATASTVIKDLSFEAPNVTIKGDLFFSPQNELIKATFPHIHAPHTDCTLTLHQHHPRELLIHVKGKAVDVGGILKEKDASPSQKSKLEKLHFALDIAQLYAGGESCLYDAKGIFDMVQMPSGFELKSCVLTGRSTPTLSQDPEATQKGMFTMSLQPLSKGERKFSLLAGDGGYLFKTLDWMQNVRKGLLTIEATQQTPLHPFEGKILLENFTVTKTPFLTQLFMTLASPTSFLGLFSGGTVSFSSFEGKASWQKGILTLRRARCQNINTALTFRHSKINTNTGTLDLKGNLIPANMINRILSAIPGIRELITGGKDDGIGATSFTVSGAFDNPQISVNPIHILTPGIIKSFVAALEEEEQPDAQKEETVSTK